jgi:hypothetical protein
MFSNCKMFEGGEELKRFSKKCYANISKVFLSQMSKVSSKNHLCYTLNIVQFYWISSNKFKVPKIEIEIFIIITGGADLG